MLTQARDHMARRFSKAGYTKLADDVRMGRHDNSPQLKKIEAKLRNT